MFVKGEAKTWKEIGRTLYQTSQIIIIIVLFFVVAVLAM